MMSSDHAPTLFVFSVLISGISFGVSFFFEVFFISSISFAFIICMLFVVILSPKTMWKNHQLQSFTGVMQK